jgi:hypothetical protein
LLAAGWLAACLFSTGDSTPLDVVYVVAGTCAFDRSSGHMKIDASTLHVCTIWCGGRRRSFHYITQGTTLRGEFYAEHVRSAWLSHCAFTAPHDMRDIVYWRTLSNPATFNTGISSSVSFLFSPVMPAIRNMQSYLYPESSRIPLFPNAFKHCAITTPSPCHS